MTVVGVTGVSGCLGQQLLMQLEVDPDVEAVVGLDVLGPPDVQSEKLRFVQRSVSEPFADVFVHHGVELAVHLAFHIDPRRDRTREQAVNVRGTQHFLDACGAAGTRTVSFVSSAAVYDARADASEVLLFEGAPLRAPGDEGRPWAIDPAVADKLRGEDLCYDFVKAHPDVALQIVRSCLVLGPNSRNAITRMLDEPVILGPRDRDPVFQFVHEDDITRAIHRLLKLGQVGVFNVAPEGVVTLSQLAQLAEKRLFRVPDWALRAVTWLGWRLGRRGLSVTPPWLVPDARHPGSIAGMKLRQEALFLFRYDSGAAFLALLEARAGDDVSRELAYEDEIEDLDDEELDDEELDDLELDDLELDEDLDDLERDEDLDHLEQDEDLDHLEQEDLEQEVAQGDLERLIEREDASGDRDRSELTAQVARIALPTDPSEAEVPSRSEGVQPAAVEDALRVGPEAPSPPSGELLADVRPAHSASAEGAKPCPRGTIPEGFDPEPSSRP